MGSYSILILKLIMFYRKPQSPNVVNSPLVRWASRTALRHSLSFRPWSLLILNNFNIQFWVALEPLYCLLFVMLHMFVTRGGI